MLGSPDWVIEILSPSTRKKDLQLKSDIYAEAGVSECWIVFPKEQIIEVFLLKEDRKYGHDAHYTIGDTILPSLFPDLEMLMGYIFEELYQVMRISSMT